MKKKIIAALIYIATAVVVVLIERKAKNFVVDVCSEKD
jgi:hypothetical protein